MSPPGPEPEPVKPKMTVHVTNAYNTSYWAMAMPTDGSNLFDENEMVYTKIAYNETKDLTLYNSDPTTYPAVAKYYCQYQTSDGDTPPGRTSSRWTKLANATWNENGTTNISIS